MFSKKPGPNPRSGEPRTVANGGATFSVIGADVAIKGDIEASADLHVDGRIHGDIACSSIVQGERSTIEGTISAETARLAGVVKGTIAVRQLVVLKTARIEGDVHYETLTIEQGAQVEGRFSPDAARSQASKPAIAPVLELGGEDEERLTLAN